MAGTLGPWDRVLRIAIGVLAAVAGLGIEGATWSWVLCAIAAIALVTGIRGYSPFGALRRGTSRHAHQH